MSREIVAPTPQVAYARPQEAWLAELCKIILQ